MEKEKKSSVQPFRLLVVGRSGAGKSYSTFRYILDLVKKKAFSVKRLVLISKTWKSDPSQKDLVSFCSEKYKGWRDNNAFEEVPIDFLRLLFDQQKKIKETSPGKLKPWLLVFDDMISESILRTNDKTLMDLFTVGRHFSISQAWLLQRFRGVMNVTLRDQFTDIVLHRVSGKKTLQDVLADYDEAPGDHRHTLQALMNMYEECLRDGDGHGSLVIHLMKNHGGGRLERGLGSGVYFDNTIMTD